MRRKSRIREGGARSRLAAFCEVGQGENMPGDRISNSRSNSGNQQIDLSDDNSFDTIYSDEEGELGEKSSRHIQNLKFKNPGRFMEDFDPERSYREMRKLNRRIYNEKVKKNQVYDNRGVLLADSRNLCDCLEKSCPGCHFQCPKCGSTKCGGDCRCNRRWYYSEVEIEGTQTKTTVKLPSVS